MSEFKCPKCHYVKTEKDAHVMKGICPSCGIAFAKWKQQQSTHPTTQTLITEIEADEAFSIKETFIATITYTPSNIDPLTFWGRVILFFLFVLWGISFMLSGVDWEEIGGSFLHNINLPFHEFGHVLFSPFGRFMTILGGSLFQIIMPLIAMVSFSLQMRDNFAAAIMLWWCGQNFIDVSPYIADAEYRVIPLIRGLGEDAHDWGNLLTMLNKVEQARNYGYYSFVIGSLIIVLSFVWAGYLLLQQKKHLDENPSM